MNNLREIISWIVGGVFLVLFIMKSCSSISEHKQLVTVTAQLYACQNVKPDTVKGTDSIVYRDTTIYVPVPVPGKTIRHDSLIYVINENWYDSSYNKAGIRFKYSIHTMGDLKGVRFDNFVWPKESITITRTVKVDTCLTPVRQFRIGAYMDFTMHTNNTTGIGLGLQAIIKQKYTVGLGAVSDNNGLGGNLRFGILF